MMQRSSVTWRAAGAILLSGTAMAAIASGVSASGAGQAPPATPSSAAEVKAALMSEGQGVFDSNCLECHTTGAGPDLTADTRLSDKDHVITQILMGTANGDMPEFGSTLSDREIAAAATFVRNSFNNLYDVVLEPEVKQRREQLLKTTDGPK
jgi:mono/diheme cytochrome c family protein